MSKSGLFAHFQSKEDVQIELLTHTPGIFANQHVLMPSMAAAGGLLPCLRARWCTTGSGGRTERGCREDAWSQRWPVRVRRHREGRVRDKILQLEEIWRRTLIGIVQRAVDLDPAILRRDLEIPEQIRLGTMRDLSGSHMRRIVSCVPPMLMRGRRSAFKALLESRDADSDKRLKSTHKENQGARRQNQCS